MGNTTEKSECNMCTKINDLDNKKKYCNRCELYIHQEHIKEKNVKCNCGKNNDIRMCCYHCELVFDNLRCRVCLIPLCKECGKYNDYKDIYYCKTHFKC